MLSVIQLASQPKEKKKRMLNQFIRNIKKKELLKWKSHASLSNGFHPIFLPDPPIHFTLNNSP